MPKIKDHVYQTFLELIKKNESISKDFSRLDEWFLKCIKKKIICFHRDKITDLSAAEVPYPIYKAEKNVTYAMFSDRKNVFFQIGCNDKTPVGKAIDMQAKNSMREFLKDLCAFCADHNQDFGNRTDISYLISGISFATPESESDQYIHNAIKDYVTSAEAVRFNHDPDLFLCPVNAFDSIYPVQVSFRDSEDHSMLVIAEIRNGKLTFHVRPKDYIRAAKKDMMNEIYASYKKEMETMNWWPDEEGHLKGIFSVPVIPGEKNISEICRKQIFSECPGLLSEQVTIITDQAVPTECWMLTKPKDF